MSLRSIDLSYLSYFGRFTYLREFRMDEILSRRYSRALIEQFNLRTNRKQILCGSAEQ